MTGGRAAGPVSKMESQLRVSCFRWMAQLFCLLGKSNTPAILFNSFRLMESFTDKFEVDRKELKVYACAALWIASKYHDEEEYFVAADFLDVLGEYSLNHLKTAERIVFNECWRELKPWTAIDWAIKEDGNRIAYKCLLGVYAAGVCGARDTLLVCETIGKMFTKQLDDEKTRLAYRAYLENKPIEFDFSQLEYYE